MKDLWNFLRQPPVSEIHHVGDLIAFFFLMPLWFVTWLTIMGGSALLLGAFVSDPATTTIVACSLFVGAVCLKWIVIPIACLIEKKISDRRWEREQPEREAAQARYQKAQEDEREYQLTVKNLKAEMRASCSHPSSQMTCASAFFDGHKYDCTHCVACDSYWKITTPQYTDWKKLREFVGPEIPWQQKDLVKKYMRNHVGRHPVEHWQQLLSEIQNGDYYFNLEGKPDVPSSLYN